MVLVPRIPSPSPPAAGAVLERRLIATPTPQRKATPTRMNRTAGRLLDCPARRPRGLDLFICAFLLPLHRNLRIPFPQGRAYPPKSTIYGNLYGEVRRTRERPTSQNYPSETV